MLYPVSHSTKTDPSFSYPYWLYNYLGDWWHRSQKTDRIFQDRLKGDMTPPTLARASPNYRSERLSQSRLPKRTGSIPTNYPTPKEDPGFVWTALNTPIQLAQHFLTCASEERGVMDKSLCLAGFDPTSVKEQFQLVKIFSLLGLICYLTSNQERKSSESTRDYSAIYVKDPLIYRNRRYG